MQTLGIDEPLDAVSIADGRCPTESTPRRAGLKATAPRYGVICRDLTSRASRLAPGTPDSSASRCARSGSVFPAGGEERVASTDCRSPCFRSSACMRVSGETKRERPGCPPPCSRWKAEWTPRGWRLAGRGPMAVTWAAGPVSVGGSAGVVLEGPLDDQEQQSDCEERDCDRLAEADHYAGDPEYGRDQA